MAKKRKSEKHIHHHVTAPVNQQPPKPLFSELTFPSIALILILLVTIIIYIPTFNAGFVWDDINYIQNNELIHTFDIGGILSDYVMGNYHPVTILVFAIEYQIFGLDETGYHLVNLLLHLANVLLVYYAILLLTKKEMVALVTALLFSIHPLHTESVAWISELKDLLYSCFFFGAYIFYIKYLDSKKREYYLLALLLFLLSLLSKAMAASLPVLLMLTDYFKQRKFTMKMVVEKTPFFLLAIIFGIVAILAQRSSDAIQDISEYSILQRIVFASYGFLTYMWKAILPLNQSAFYPYPVTGGESLGVQFYIFPLLVLLLLVFVFYSQRFTKKIFFGVGFFAVTVALVLQLLPVGNAVMADRYSYIPLFGIFYLMAEGFSWLWNRFGRRAAISILALFTVFFSITTFLRNRVWKDGITLWADVISKFPKEAIGYNNRGGIYLGNKQYNSALADLNKSIELRPDYAEALNNRGVILSEYKRYNEAINDLNRAIKLAPNYPEAYNNRGTILLEMKRYQEALHDINKAIELRPRYAQAYYNRGLVFMDEMKYDLAIKDYEKALEIKPDYAEAIINKAIILKTGNDNEKILADYNKAITASPGEAQLYYNRGVVLMNNNQNIAAIADFNKAIDLIPGYSAAYVMRANTLLKERDTTAAFNDYLKAIELDPRSSEAYSGRANIFRDRNEHDKAIGDYKKAIELNPGAPAPYYNRGILFIKLKNFEAVISDFSKVLELKGDSAMSYYNRGMAELFLNRKEEACKDLKTAAGFGMAAAIDANKQFCQ